MFTLKRIYEKASSQDGQRVLVDRLWPRGLSKEKAQLNFWLKEIAPSDDLRKWFSHDSGKWTEFEKRYRTELKAKREIVAQLEKLEQQHNHVTLLYGAKDVEHNNAVILKKFVESS